VIEVRQNTDLFSLDVDAIAHGVNCQGVMGSGVALGVRNKYPAVYAHYKEYVAESERRAFTLLGTSFPVLENNMVVFNLFTQEFYGNDGRQYASLEACAAAFADMFVWAPAADIKTIAMPCIGAGLGGLSWSDVRAVLEAEYDKSPYEGDIIIAQQ
jgi:O-acetyl-ADP-ribose deacetylase (regulator of RNase III)